MIDSNEGGMGVQSAVIRPERSRLFAAVAGMLVLTGLWRFSLLPGDGAGTAHAAVGLPPGRGPAGNGPPGWTQRLPPPCPCSIVLTPCIPSRCCSQVRCPWRSPCGSRLAKSWPLPSPSAYTSARMPPRLRWSRWRPHMRSAQGLPKGWRSCSRPRWRHPISRACSCIGLARRPARRAGWLQRRLAPVFAGPCSGAADAAVSAAECSADAGESAPLALCAGLPAGRAVHRSARPAHALRGTGRWSGPGASGRTQGACGVPARFPPDGDSFTSALGPVPDGLGFASADRRAGAAGADPGPALLRNLFLRLSAGGCSGPGMHALCAHSRAAQRSMARFRPCSMRCFP